MLISFRFKNSRSFSDETILDMKAVTYKEHPEHLAFIDNKKILKTMAVYGANASGKTNLIRTLINFQSFVSMQLFPDYGVDESPLLSIVHQNVIGQFTPFWRPEGYEKPIEMVITFSCDGHMYEYGFSIYNQDILTEHLTYDHHLVFTREGESVSVGRLYSKTVLAKEPPPIRSRWLLSGFLASLNVSEFNRIMQPFKHFFSRGISYYFDFVEGLKNLDNISFYKQTHYLMKDPAALEYALAQLRRFGIPAECVIVERGMPKLGYRLKSRDTGQDFIQYMDLDRVSEGTLKHLALFERIYMMLNCGGTLLIDNMSNNFHPAVTKFIIDLFQTKGNENAQLIFTTYDISILNNQQFRRDEVAFVDINEYNESHLYTLADIKVRSDASFSKDYLLGKYGAVPILKDIMSPSI